MCNKRWAGCPIGTIRDRGWLVGGHAGFNWQFGSWVVGGLEADVDATGMKGSASTGPTTTVEQVTVEQLVLNTTTAPDTIGVSVVPALAQVTRSVDFHSKIDLLASLRARLGFLVVPQFLLYGTGGAAWAHTVDSISLSQTTRCIPTDTFPCVVLGGELGASPIPLAPQTESFSATAGSTHFGWAAGGGGEWKFLPNWILGVEYLHYDFPRNSLSFGNGSISFTLPGDHHISVDAVRARLSWLFTLGPVPVVAGY
jgi:outer membrane immunogenic protein